MKIGNFDTRKDGTFIIAELSANHNGSLHTAIQTIKAAKEAGANAIKLQTYTADTLTLNSQNEEFILKGGTLWDGKSLYELYKQAYTPWEWHEKLFSVAKEEGLECFSAPFDKSAVDFLENLNPPVYKIASCEITDYELVRYCAKKQKPILISTGIATLEEIQDVVNICKHEGNDDILLFQCTSSYPTPISEANLLKIPSLHTLFNVEVGLSDHTLGITAPIVAVSFGATVIEKHFILDKSIGGADAGFSLDKQEFTLMCKHVREAEKSRGNPTFTFDKTKQKNRYFARSLYVSKPIKKGEVFTIDNIKSIRPFHGLHPKYLYQVLGKKATCDLDFATPLKEYHVAMFTCKDM